MITGKLGRNVFCMTHESSRREQIIDLSSTGFEWDKICHWS